MQKRHLQQEVSFLFIEKAAVPKDSGWKHSLKLLNYSRVAKCLMVRHI